MQLRQWNKRTLDGRVEVLRDRHHHFGAEHPEHVVHEKAAKKDRCRRHSIEADKLDRVHGKCEPEQVIH